MEATIRLVGQQPVYTERSPEGEERHRTASHVFYARLMRAPSGREFIDQGTASGEWPQFFHVREEALPPGFNLDWSVIDERGNEFDAVSLQPLPNRSSFMELKLIQRRQNVG